MQTTPANLIYKCIRRTVLFGDFTDPTRVYPVVQSLLML